MTKQANSKYTLNSFLKQGIVLTLISIFLRLTSIYYRSFLTNKIGADGMGLYQLIISVFLFAVTLSTSGISLTVTRLVSGAISRNERYLIRSILNKCFMFCTLLSLLISFLLVCFSDFAALHFLGNIEASPCLKILGIGLPFMSLCTCMKGYFLAVDEGIAGGIADILEQILTIMATFIIFNIFATNSIINACIGAVVASTFGEIVSFVWDFYSCRKSLRKNTPKEKTSSTGVFYSLSHIALPCTASSATRSLLSTTENLLIPIELQKGGFSYDDAMTSYGLMHAMALPVLYFPSAFLWSFAVLLIPKISAAYEIHHKLHVAYMVEKSISVSLAFGVICSATFFAFGDTWGLVFYNSSEAGAFIKILAPIVPLMYLDIVVDNILKGLDLQLHSMEFNMIDATFRVILVLLFLSIGGLNAYIGIIIFSTIFNATLSLGKVLKVTQLSFNIFKKLIYQIPFAVLAVLCGERAIEFLSPTKNSVILGVEIGVSFSVFIIITLLLELILPKKELKLRSINATS